ncbi:Fic family protein [Stenoxybacter acetivorans]|uniref:Fic family protein n=1 Tax=Stenoxybacter acetivorans TaxID=422441 RepID=UPI00055D275A|nr:Fic family protein [Stenoxybacter acetivorans]
MAHYLYQHPNWTAFTWQAAAISGLLGETRYLQGRLLGQVQSLGFLPKTEKHLETLTVDILQSSAIEGENLNYAQTRSSVARRLGLEMAGLVPSARHIDGVVEMMLDATQSYQKPLTESRLFGWYASLFPTGYSGMFPIVVGQYRHEEMQIISGAVGKEKVYYQAIPPKQIPAEMATFLQWFNQESDLDHVLKAAIAHLWFLSIHPFDDGNGRIARALSDVLLARSEHSSERFYSFSKQIHAEKKQYYQALQNAQHGDTDITQWLQWFLTCLKHALQDTEISLQSIVKKAEFWQQHRDTVINERQRLIINRLFDSFSGNLTSSKWAKITKTSADTALRDINDLIAKGILQKSDSGGRSAHYWWVGKANFLSQCINKGKC